MSTLLIKNNKGQLKIQQMVFMILAITIFFILAGLFFLALKVTNLERDAQELNQDKAVGLVNKISSNPEITFEGIPNSIDADKLMVLKDSKTYPSFFGVDGIIVQKVYPVESNEEILCTTSNYPDCNKIKLFTHSEVASTQSFVSWCRKKSLNGNSYDECSLAILMIEEREIN